MCVPVLSHSLQRGCSWPIVSITSHQPHCHEPRKVDVRARPSPAVPKAGTSHTQPVLGTVMPLTVLWVPLGTLGEEGHMRSPTLPAVSRKRNSKERGININKLICIERLSLVPQPDSTQKEG